MTLYRDDTEDGIPLVTFIDGDEYRRVVPVEPDYESAKVPATDTFAMFASKMLGISHAEAMQRDDIQEAGAIIAAATVDAALRFGETP